mgnify:CR=1 FL=1
MDKLLAEAAVLTMVLVIAGYGAYSLREWLLKKWKQRAQNRRNKWGPRKISNGAKRNEFCGERTTCPASGGPAYKAGRSIEGEGGRRGNQA